MIDIEAQARRAIAAPIAPPPEMARISAIAARYRRRRATLRAAVAMTAASAVVVVAVVVLSPRNDPGLRVITTAPTSVASVTSSPSDTVLAPDLTFDHFVSRLVVAHHVVREGAVGGTPLARFAHLLCVDGTALRVYEFPDRSARTAVSDTISSDGSRVANASVDWVGPPHFFADGRVIVLLLSDNHPLLTWLTGALGPTLSPLAHPGPGRDHCRQG